MHGDRHLETRNTGGLLMTRFAFLLAAVAAVARGQSRIRIDQLRRGSKDADQIVAVDARGEFYALRLGSGVTIVNGELRANAEPAAPLRLLPNTDGSYPKAARIARNGLIQTPAVDYRVEADRLVPLTAWSAEDVIASF